MLTRPLRASVWLRTAVAGSALVSTLVLAAPTEAQVCGDASGDGTVTVADGVQVLRAAAELSNTCTPAMCDVDGNGTIAVADGVNVLRKAADLSAPNNCGGGNPDAEVASVSNDVAPLLIFAFAAISDVQNPLPSGSAASVQPAGTVVPIDEDDCPDGGVRRKILLGGCIVNVRLDACRYSAPGLGSFEFNRGIAVNFCRSEVAMGVDVTDRDSGRIVNFDGFFAFQSNGGGFVADGGPVTLTTPQGNFALSFQQLTFNDEGQPTSGSGRIEDTDDNFTLQSIDFTATGGGSASLVATFDDSSQKSFVLNLITGALVPA